MYGKEDGSVPATFQIIFMVRSLPPLCTWPHPSYTTETGKEVNVLTIRSDGNLDLTLLNL
jgi:hypothetical protein